jgi:hypothetical protein
MHDGFDHQRSFQNDCGTQQVVVALGKMLVQPMMTCTCILVHASVNDVQKQCICQIAFTHALPGMRSDDDRQLEAHAEKMVHLFSPSVDLDQGTAGIQAQDHAVSNCSEWIKLDSCLCFTEER